ncbi:hypothetical protein [Neptunomonas sp. XY-337]|uniref:hypothetical protein n=1 Tax=Neptunomonas sp. XY-337 TaxID=2561897 RepID=UPI0010AA6B10|nr:hypothetical protein [Neptunomonas sp. XY-337]
MIGLRSGAYVVVASLLTACGGGGGGDDAPPPTDEVLTKEGVFLDSPVEGLYYTAGDMTGYTDNEGRFYYPEGSTVSFAMGDISLGSALGNAILTPKSLLPGLENRLDRRLTNQLRLLQTLDSDANPDNGIQLYSQVHNYLAGQTINFNLSETDFAAQTAIQDLLRLFGKDQLVAPLDALEHFYAQQLAVLNPSETEWTEITRLEFEAALEPGTQWQSRRVGSYEGLKQEGDSAFGFYPVSNFEQEALDIDQISITSNRRILSCNDNDFSSKNIDAITGCKVTFNNADYGTEAIAQYYRSESGNLRSSCPAFTTNRTLTTSAPEGETYQVTESFTTQFERILFPIKKDDIRQLAVVATRNGNALTSSINCIKMSVTNEDPHGDQLPEIRRHNISAELYSDSVHVATLRNSYDAAKIPSSNSPQRLQRFTYFTLNGRPLRAEGASAPAVEYRNDIIKTVIEDSTTGTTYTINVAATPELP